MDPQLDQRLSAIEKQLMETNKIVSKLAHAQIAARNRKLVYWGIIIVLTIISFYSIKPYIEQLKDAYSLGDSDSSTNADYSDLLKGI
jgi:type II secretory pathway component PulM